MVRNEPRSKTTFGMSLALPQRGRQSWHRLQTEGTREEEHSASSCGLPTSLLPREGCPNQCRGSDKGIWAAALAEHPQVLSVSLRRALLRCTTAVLSCSRSFLHTPSVQIQEGDGFQGKEAQMLGNPGRRLI